MSPKLLYRKSDSSHFETNGFYLVSTPLMGAEHEKVTESNLPFTLDPGIPSSHPPPPPNRYSLFLVCCLSLCLQKCSCRSSCGAKYRSLSPYSGMCFVKLCDRCQEGKREFESFKRKGWKGTKMTRKLNGVQTLPCRPQKQKNSEMPVLNRAGVPFPTLFPS